MEIGFKILKNQYYDSVFLMGINNKISKVEGVNNSAVLMGTEINKKLLIDIGISDPEIVKASPSDLIVGLVTDNIYIVKSILDNLDSWFAGGLEQSGDQVWRTMEDGLAHQANTNLVVISVPGDHAFRETKKALDKNINVFLFSNNVPVSEEVELKKYAEENSLIVMGPDCGTSIIAGVGIGFANKVRLGKIGVIGVSGTGLQEFTCQVHNHGFGISHAIGTGGRDLSNEVGGITTLAALNALENDKNTDVIAIVSKPAGLLTLKKINEKVRSLKKPVIACFLGLNKDFSIENYSLNITRTIDEAVQLSIQELKENNFVKDYSLTEIHLKILESEKTKLGHYQKYLRGVFAGGTFCYQAQQILKDCGINVYSNTPIDKKWILQDPNSSQENCMVDMGDDIFTVTRPHPMIDGTYRRKRILDEGKNSQVAVLLIDIILGFNASADPVGDIIEAIIEAKQMAKSRGDYLCVVASVCGTDDDFQEKGLQVDLLEKAGVIVFDSNAQASMFCAELIT